MSDELRKVLGIAEDPYVDAPLWEDDEEIERTRGICEICVLFGFLLGVMFTAGALAWYDMVSDWKDVRDERRRRRDDLHSN
jgi:hypothetical protein